MKIRNIDLGTHPVLLAPMEDVTDQAFRLLCREFGASMVYSEFVSADALIRNVNRQFEKMRIDDRERPVVVQIYGRDIPSMTEAAKIVESEAHPDIIDINWGCPVKKIASKGAGSGMLQNPQLLLDITREVVKAVNTPVTVKTRLGWNHDMMLDAHLTIPDAPQGRPFIIELAERLQDCGISALTIHGRTRSQMYQGEADWRLIGEVKNNPRITIPIIGNGDITTAEETQAAFDTYGVDAVMIGRATFGCPWFFSSRQLSLDEKIDVLLEQLRINVERLDEYRGILHTRRHLAATPVFKGIPDFRQTRIAMLRADTVKELTSIMEEVRERLKGIPSQKG